jgi:hypothetical protein
VPAASGAGLRRSPGRRLRPAPTPDPAPQTHRMLRSTTSRKVSVTPGPSRARPSLKSKSRLGRVEAFDPGAAVTSRGRSTRGAEPAAGVSETSTSPSSTTTDAAGSRSASSKLAAQATAGGQAAPRPATYSGELGPVGGRAGGLSNSRLPRRAAAADGSSSITITSHAVSRGQHHMSRAVARAAPKIPHDSVPCAISDSVKAAELFGYGCLCVPWAPCAQAEQLRACSSACAHDRVVVLPLAAAASPPPRRARALTPAWGGLVPFCQPSGLQTHAGRRGHGPVTAQVNRQRRDPPASTCIRRLLNRVQVRPSPKLRHTPGKYRPAPGPGPQTHACGGRAAALAGQTWPATHPARVSRGGASGETRNEDYSSTRKATVHPDQLGFRITVSGRVVGASNPPIADQ